MGSQQLPPRGVREVRELRHVGRANCARTRDTSDRVTKGQEDNWLNVFEQLIRSVHLQQDLDCLLNLRERLVLDNPGTEGALEMDQVRAQVIQNIDLLLLSRV